MELISQSALLVSIVSFTFGGAVFSRNVKNKLYLAFFVLCSTISLWALFFFLEQLKPIETFYHWHLFFNFWLGPIGIIFVRTLTRTHDFVSKLLLNISLVLTLILTGFWIFAYEDQFQILFTIYFYAPVLLVLQVIYQMFLEHKQAVSAGVQKKVATVALERRNLIYIGGLIVLGSSVMDHAPFMGTVVPAIGNFGLTIYLFFLSQAITQQRFFSVGALVSKFLVLATLAFFLTAVYSLVFAFIEQKIALFLLNSFIISFGLSTLFDPLRRGVAVLTEKLLSKKQSHLISVVQEAREKTVGEVDPIILQNEVFDFVQKTMSPERVGIYFLESDGSRFRLAASRGAGTEKFPVEVARTHRVLEYTEALRGQTGVPVILDHWLENEKDRSVSRTDREKFQSLLWGLEEFGGNLIISLKSESSVLGLLVVRVSQPPAEWGNNWSFLTLLMPYMELVAQNLRSADIFVRSRERERLAALGEMAAGLAHEIRNPLGAIKGAAQLLTSGSMSNTGESPAGVQVTNSKFLGVIVEEVDRLNRVVTQFLEYSKPQSGEKVTISLPEIVDRVVMFLKPTIPNEIEVDWKKPDHNLMMELRAEKIQQVAVNLIQNAVRAVQGATNPKVSIRCQKIMLSTVSWVELTVEDNGKGIPQENIEKIFIPFFTTSPEGTGLGLSICQKIVEGHGGRMSVQSEVGRFTRFSVLLPNR